MIHPARLAIATVALIFASGSATAQTSQTSGGLVDPALIEDLVAANRIPVSYTHLTLPTKA